MPEVLNMSQNYMVSKCMLYSYIRDKFAMYQCQKYYKIRDLIFFLTYLEPVHPKEGNGKLALLCECRMH